MIVNFCIGLFIWSFYFYLLYYLTKQESTDMKLIRFVVVTGWVFMIIRLITTNFLN